MTTRTLFTRRLITLLAMLALAMTSTACSKKESAGGGGGGSSAKAKTPGKTGTKGKGATSTNGKGSAKKPGGAKKPGDVKKPASDDPTMLSVTITGDYFSKSTDLKTAPGDANTLTKPLVAGKAPRALMAQGLVDVPGKGKRYASLIINLHEGIKKGTFSAAPATSGPFKDAGKATFAIFDSERMGAKTIVNGNSTGGSITIDEVGPKFRGFIKGKFDISTKPVSGGKPFKVQGTFVIRHMM